jgi:hypothetical protein
MSSAGGTGPVVNPRSSRRSSPILASGSRPAAPPDRALGSTTCGSYGLRWSLDSMEPFSRIAPRLISPRRFSAATASSSSSVSSVFQSSSTAYPNSALSSRSLLGTSRIGVPVTTSRP